MDSNFQIISDGSCDLPPELAEKKHIRVVPFYVSFDNKNYQKEIEEIGIREFYQKMVDNPGVYPKSSLPSIQDYYDAFETYAREKVPVFCICITTKFSGSMQSALSAKELILEDYPEAVITVMDATVNTVLQGLLVLEAAAMQESGAGYEETIARIKEIRSSGRIFFTVGNMEYLKAGGRIGKVAGAAGALLGINNDDKYIGAIMTVFLNRNLSSEGMIIGGNVSYNGKRITPLIKNKGTILRLMATYKVNNDLYWEVINFDNRNFALVNLTAVEGSNILFLLDRTTSANPDKSMSGTLKELSDYWDTI